MYLSTAHFVVIAISVSSTSSKQPFRVRAHTFQSSLKPTAMDLGYSSHSDYGSDSDFDDIPLSILSRPCIQSKPSFALQMPILVQPNKSQPLLTSRPAKSVPEQPAAADVDRNLVTHCAQARTSPQSLQITANELPLMSVPDVSHAAATARHTSRLMQSVPSNSHESNLSGCAFMPKANSDVLNLGYSSSSDCYSDSDLEDVPLSLVAAPCNKPKPSFNLQMPSLALANNREAPLLTSRPARTVCRQQATDSVDRLLLTHRPHVKPNPPSLPTRASSTANTVPVPDITNTAATGASGNSSSDQDMTWVYLLSPAFALEGTAKGNGDVSHDGIHSPVKQFIQNYFKSSFGMEAADLSLFKIQPSNPAGQGTQIAVQFNGKGFTTQRLEELLVEVNNLQTTNQELQGSNKSLQDELKALQNANKSLQDKLKAMQAENQALHTSQVTSVNLNNTMYDDIRKFSEEVRKLNKNISTLQEEKVRLAMENASLVAQAAVSTQEPDYLKHYLELQNLQRYASKSGDDDMKSAVERLQAQFKATVTDSCCHNGKLVSPKTTHAWLSKTAGHVVQQAVADKVHASKCDDDSLDMKSVEERLQAQFKAAVGGSCCHKGKLVSPKAADALVQKATGRGRHQAVVDKMKQSINGRGARDVQQTLVDKMKQPVNGRDVQQTKVGNVQQPVNGRGARLVAADSVLRATGGSDDGVMINAAGRHRSSGSGSQA